MSNNNKWGGQPQKSDTSAGNKRGWGHGAPQKSDTTGSGNSADDKRTWGQGAPQKSNTGAGNNRPDGHTRYEVPTYSVYILNNVMYRNVGLLSEESGEAKIFEISAGDTHYALKMYRHGIKPNHAILDKIMKLRGNGLLIDIYDHGTWHDDRQNADFDYEVMQLCTGGSLAGLQLNGNEEKLKETALKMTVAIDFLHRNGILHRDVKPANFLFIDKKQTHFVLSDWGFARLLDKDGRTVTDDGRTKLYTAPELYIDIPGRDTYADAKADYFSLGMSLLALWKGEGLLIADEQKLVRQKLDEELPYPSRKEMSQHTLSLIKALTRNNPEKRAGFDDIKRWAKGEVIFHDPNDDNQLKDYKIVFSGEKNLIAHNNVELARMMWENKELAKKYLYDDRIADWLRDVDRPEMAIWMNDITEMDYPSDRDAGLYAACLLLDPDMPFYGVNGNKITTQQGLADEIFYNSMKYIPALGTAEHPLWVYCKAVGLEDLIKKFQDKKISKENWHFFELAFRLDPTLPYPVPVMKNGKSQTKLAKDLKEYAELFYSGDQTIFYYQSRDDFQVWLNNVDPAMAGRAKTFISKYSGQANSGQLIHYSILPDLGFDGKPLDRSVVATPQQIAEVFLAEICKKAEGKSCTLINFSKFSQSSINAYLISKEKYQDQIRWVGYCMDLESADNQRKTGYYDKYIAELKVLAGWHGGSIPITLHGKTFTGTADIVSADLSDFSKSELSLLSEWAMLLFQENPNADYKAKSYTKRTLEYFKFIEKHIPDCNYMDNYRLFDADRPVDKALSRNKRSWIKVRTVQLLSILICFIPMIIVCCWMGYLAVTTGSEPLKTAIMGLGHWAAIIIGVLVGICCYEGGFIGIAIGGFVTYWVVELIFKFLAPVVPWLVIVLLVGIVIFFTMKMFVRPGKRFVTGSMSMDEIVTRHKAGLAFYTHRKLLPDKDDDYPMSELDRSTNYANGYMPGLVKNALLMLAITVGGVFLCGWVVGNYDKIPSGTEQSIAGDYVGDVQGTPSQIKLYLNKDGYWEADMTINYKAGPTQQVMVAKEKSEEPGTLYLESNPKVKLTLQESTKDLEGTKDTKDQQEAARTLTGNYVNSKGNTRTIHYKQTETAKK